MGNEIKNLVIAGGGTAGWMAAAAFAKVMGPQINITLVESDEIGIIGVGEATIPSIKIFNDILQIDENDFVAATNGTFKLGIEFKNWTRHNHSYRHEFGNIGKDLAYIDFHHYWAARWLQGNQENLWDYSLNELAANANKFARIDKIANTPVDGMPYAFHFDAGLYVKYLRKIAENLGVKRREGKITAAITDAGGNIKAIKMADGEEINGDFFIDCTGLAGLLIEKALNSEFLDYSDYLPVNRAIALPCENVSPLTPYTRSTAQDSGWTWRIPLQSRIGNGHVYCSDFISDDEALKVLYDNIDGKPIADPRLIKFKIGRRRQFWRKNCVAIGLSSGFLEPLESTAIYLIQTAVTQLIMLFPHAGENQYLRDEFNQKIGAEFDFIRDFIFLHYHANERHGEKFWDMMRDKPLPDSLNHKIELFREAGIIHPENFDIFKLSSWLQVMVGQNILPQAAHPFVQTVNPKDLDEYMTSLRAIMQNAVGQMPSHEDFIAKNCRMKN